MYNFNEIKLLKQNKNNFNKWNIWALKIKHSKSIKIFKYNILYHFSIDQNEYLVC
jgi:hypothetical protein